MSDSQNADEASRMDLLFITLLLFIIVHLQVLKL